MKKNKTNYDKLADYLARCINKFHPDQTVYIVTRGCGFKYFSYLVAMREEFLSTEGKYKTLEGQEIPGMSEILYIGDFEDTKTTSVERLVESFLSSDKNETNIHNVNQLKMKMELDGEKYD